MPYLRTRISCQNLESLEKSELIERLLALEMNKQNNIEDSEFFQNQSIMHELQVHQVELEMQNRELRKTHDLLEVSRSRYAELYEYAPVGFCTLDFYNRIEEVNLMATKILHLPRDALLHQQLGSFVSPQSREKLYEHLRRCAETGEKTYSEIDFEPRKSFATCLQVISIPKRHTSSESSKGMLVTFIDVSEQKDLAAQISFLSHVSEILSETLDVDLATTETVRLAVPFLSEWACLDICYGYRPITRLTSMTDEFKKRHDALQEEAQCLCAPTASYIQSYVERSTKGVLVKSLDSDQAEQFIQNQEAKQVLRKLQGESILAVPLHARGHVLGALTLVRSAKRRPWSSDDLQLAKNYARRAAMAIDNAYLHNVAHRAVQARGSLLAIVSHDLRNPLSVIAMKSEQIIKTTQAIGEAKVQRSANVILRCATRMNRLIGDLLDISSIESNHFSVQKGVHDVHLIVEEALETAQSLAEVANIRLNSYVALSCPVVCDCDRTLQVLGNLLGNAIKFTQPGGQVILKVCRDGRDALFSIEDTGKGMTKQEMRQVFDRFWQADTSVHMGVGLGLSIAKGVIEASGGRVWVQSQMGVGSTFCFTLPLELGQQETKTVDEPNILVVEDQEDSRQSLHDLLAHAGYTVKTVANGLEALKYLQVHRETKLIFLDLQMPIMNGWQFLEERKKDTTLLQIPTVVFSGEVNVTQDIEAARARFLPKTASARELLQTVRNMYS